MRACSSNICIICICCCGVITPPGGIFCIELGMPPIMLFTPIPPIWRPGWFRPFLFWKLRGPRGGSRLCVSTRPEPPWFRTRCSTDSLERSIALEIWLIWLFMSRPRPFGFWLRMVLGPVGLQQKLVSLRSVKSTRKQTHTHFLLPCPYHRLHP